MPECGVWLGRKSCDLWGWPHTGMHGSMQLNWVQTRALLLTNHVIEGPALGPVSPSIRWE